MWHEVETSYLILEIALLRIARPILNVQLRLELFPQPTIKSRLARVSLLTNLFNLDTVQHGNGTAIYYVPIIYFIHNSCLC